MARTTGSRHTLRWVVAVAALAVALVLGVPYAYIHLVQGDAPDRLAAATEPAAAATTSTTAATGAAGDTLDGTWTVSSGSQAGYRVKEVLLGQDTEAVGRTSAVTGQLAVAGDRVERGSFTVDLTQVASDEQRRDAQFQGRIMDTATYPTATFELTEPITLPSTPTDGTPVTATATGDLTLHGTTRSVTLQVTVQRSATGFQVNGSIPVTFADYGIPNPSFGPVTTDDHGEIEFLLTLATG